MDGVRLGKSLFFKGHGSCILGRLEGRNPALPGGSADTLSGFRRSEERGSNVTRQI